MKIEFTMNCYVLVQNGVSACCDNHHPPLVTIVTGSCVVRLGIFCHNSPHSTCCEHEWINTTILKDLHFFGTSPGLG